MLKKIQMFLRDEEGATAVEYGLILGIVALVIVAAFSGASESLKTIFGGISDSLTKAAATK